MTGQEFAQEIARRLDLPPLEPSEIDTLLAMAGTAAHASERLAAPLCTYLAGRSGREPADVHEVVRALVSEG